MRARSGGVCTSLSFGPLPFTQSFQDPDCQPLARCHRRNRTDQCNAVACLAGPGPGAGAVASAISSYVVSFEADSSTKGIVKHKIDTGDPCAEPDTDPLNLLLIVVWQR